MKLKKTAGGKMPQPARPTATPAAPVTVAVAPAFGAVEKMMLGAAPTDPDPQSRPQAALPDLLTVRLGAVRTFLAAQPALRASLDKEIDAAWRRAEGDRAVFIRDFAERRAQILSAAALAPAPAKAAAAFDAELARYLTAMEGYGG